MNERLNYGLLKKLVLMDFNDKGPVYGENLTIEPVTDKVFL